MTSESQPPAPAGELLVFVGDDGAAQVHVRVVAGTVWLTQRQLATLYGKAVPTINEHLANIYEESELDPAATIRKLSALDRVVSMYLDYAEDQARKRQPMTMADWVAKLDGFLRFHERNILTHAGTVTQALAAAHAEAELERYDAGQRRLEAETPTSDFDRLIDASDKLALAAPTKPARRKR